MLGPWKKKLVVQRSLFLWKVCGRFWCQKWSEIVWMDSRQSEVQKDRLGNFQWKNCSTELRLYTRFLRLLVASGVSEGEVCVSPMWMEVGWGFGREVLFETMSRHSVLLSFSLSLFDVIHVFISEMQFCMPWTEVSIWSGRQESCSWVSSAKDCLDMECRRMSVVRSFVYKMNRIGPRTEPCVTPKLSKVGCESLLLMVTVWVLLER